MKKTGAWLIAAMIAGMAGGMVSISLWNDREAFAEKSPKEKRVVTAEDFHLVDREGKMRAALFVSAKGEPGFALFDKEGKDHLLLMLNADGSAVIDLLDSAGASRARLALANDGTPGLTLIGDPTVTLLDKAKQPLWKAP